MKVVVFLNKSNNNTTIFKDIMSFISLLSWDNSEKFACFRLLVEQKIFEDENYKITFEEVFEYL